MTTVAATAERRVLPRGWFDLFRQVLIWFGFILAYQLARGVADRSPSVAFENARGVIDFERRATGLWELSLQSWTESFHTLGVLTSWTYWLSQFAVVGLALLWVYFRRGTSPSSASSTRSPRSEPRTTARPSSSWLRTPTRRCRACMPPTH